MTSGNTSSQSENKALARRPISVSTSAQLPQDGSSLRTLREGWSTRLKRLEAGDTSRNESPTENLWEAIPVDEFWDDFSVVPEASQNSK